MIDLQQNSLNPMHSSDLKDGHSLTYPSTDECSQDVLDLLLSLEKNFQIFFNTRGAQYNGSTVQYYNDIDT